MCQALLHIVGLHSRDKTDKTPCSYEAYVSVDAGRQSVSRHAVKCWPVISAMEQNKAPKGLERVGGSWNPPS